MDIDYSTPLFYSDRFSLTHFSAPNLPMENNLCLSRKNIHTYPDVERGSKEQDSTYKIKLNVGKEILPPKELNKKSKKF